MKETQFFTCTNHQKDKRNSVLYFPCEAQVHLEVKRHASACILPLTATSHSSDFLEEENERSETDTSPESWSPRPTHLACLCGTACGVNAECVVWFRTPLEEISPPAPVFQCFNTTSPTKPTANNSWVRQTTGHVLLLALCFCTISTGWLAPREFQLLMITCRRTSFFLGQMLFVGSVVIWGYIARNIVWKWLLFFIKLCCNVKKKTLQKGKISKVLK